jgi:hypothetical protein
MDRFVTFAALEVLAGHDSGYSLGRNNYRIYHDPASDQIVFIPHDLGNLFSKADAPLFPKWKGQLAKAVLDNPEGQKRYRDRMTALLGNSCKIETVNTRVDDLASKIRPAFARDAAAAKSFDTGLQGFRERIAQRLKFIDEELKKPAK